MDSRKMLPVNRLYLKLLWATFAMMPVILIPAFALGSLALSRSEWLFMLIALAWAVLMLAVLVLIFFRIERSAYWISRRLPDDDLTVFLKEAAEDWGHIDD